MFEALFVVVGAVVLKMGITRGFIDRRMPRRGEILEGPAAVRAGIFLVLIGSFSWACAALLAWAWLNGKVEW